MADGRTVIDAVATRLGPDGTFARLLLLNNLAVIQIATSDHPTGARSLLEAALREWRPGENENDFELISIPQNLAIVVDQPARSLELLAQARAAAVRLLGEAHPRVIEIDRVRVVFLDLDRARALKDDACARLRMFPELIVQRADCEYQSGWLADEADDSTAAVAHFAVPVDAKTNVKRAQIATAMIALANAGTDAAKLAAELELTAVADSKAESPFARAAAADAYIAAARAWHVRGNAAAELRCWDGARQLLEAIARPAVARRLARSRAAVARRSPPP